MATKKLNAMIPIADVFFDEELYPRSSYNWQTGYDYSESMKTGAKFPQIILAVYQGKKYLVDGKHRLEATKILKKKSIAATIYTGWTRNKIFEEAVISNISHGKSLCPYEKRNIALKLRLMKYPDMKISGILNIPLGKLQPFIKQRMVNTLTGKLVDQKILKSAVKHLAGSKMSKADFKKVEEQQKRYNLNNQIDFLEQFLSMLQNGLVDITDKRIGGLISQIKGYI